MTPITRRLPPSLCACGKSVDAATPSSVLGTAPDAIPAPGHLTVCAYCGRAYQFTASLHLEPCDVEALPDDVRRAVRRMQTAATLYHRVPS